MPKYRLNQNSYIDNVLYVFIDDPEKDHKNIHEIDARHVPGPHWQPMDDEAKKICQMHGIVYTGETPDCVEDMTKQLAHDMAKQAALAATAAANSPSAIAQAIVGALIEAGVVTGTAKKKGGAAAALAAQPETEEV